MILGKCVSDDVKSYVELGTRVDIFHNPELHGIATFIDGYYVEGVWSIVGRNIWLGLFTELIQGPQGNE